MLNCGANVDLKGGREGSALFAAAAYGQNGAIKLLLTSGAATSYFDGGTEP